MELNFFMRELESELIERGITAETAKKHVANLHRSFSSDDLSEIEAIQSSEEIKQLADSIAAILNKNKKNILPSDKVQNNNTQDQAVISDSFAITEQSKHDNDEMLPKSNHQKSSKHNDDMSLVKAPDDYFYYSNKEKCTSRGMITFWLGLLLTLPFSLAVLAAIFGAFAAVFAVLTALIIGGIAILIAIVAAGAGVSLVGIIFGITQLFSFSAAGIYEIGLGIMVAGVVLFVSIIIYNITIRLIPWLISRVAVFLRFVCRKIKALFIHIKKECYKL